MNRIILLKVFFIFILLQGCNNHTEIIEKDKKQKNFILSPALEDKYHFKEAYLGNIQFNSHFEDIHTYNSALIFGKKYSKEHGFMNSDIYKYCECVLVDDSLYVRIRDGNGWDKSVCLKIEPDKYETVATISTDIAPTFVLASTESTLKISSNKFHVGDTIIGEISSFYRDHRDSTWGDYEGYSCEGYFIGIIDKATEEWEKANLKSPIFQ